MWQNLKIKMSEHNHKHEQENEHKHVRDFNIITLKLTEIEYQRIKSFKDFDDFKRHLHIYYSINPLRVLSAMLMQERGYNPFTPVLIVKIKLFEGIENLDFVDDIEDSLF